MPALVMSAASLGIRGAVASDVATKIVTMAIAVLATVMIIVAHSVTSIPHVVVRASRKRNILAFARACRRASIKVGEYNGACAV